MAAYLYEGTGAPSGSFIGLKGEVAFVEPDSMPGNTTFVAGFTQCES